LSDAAPDAWRQPVPADLVASLPVETNTAAAGDRDPNRLVHFSQAGRLYRVTRPFFCPDVRACAFRELYAAEVTEPLFGNCERERRTARRASIRMAGKRIRVGTRR